MIALPPPLPPIIQDELPAPRSSAESHPKTLFCLAAHPGGSGADVFREPLGPPRPPHPGKGQQESLSLGTGIGCQPPSRGSHRRRKNREGQRHRLQQEGSGERSRRPESPPPHRGGAWTWTCLVPSPWVLWTRACPRLSCLWRFCTPSGDLRQLQQADGSCSQPARAPHLHPAWCSPDPPKQSSGTRNVSFFCSASQICPRDASAPGFLTWGPLPLSHRAGPLWPPLACLLGAPAGGAEEGSSSTRRPARPPARCPLGWRSLEHSRPRTFLP